MIERYEIKEISSIWTDDFKFQTFLDVECALLEVLEESDVLKDKISHKFKKCKIDVNRIAEIEKETRHDVIAFCTSITEQVDVETSKFFHYGVTSSDVIDTSLTLQIKKSLEVILPLFEDVVISLRKKSFEHKNTLCMGRSHGIWAEPMSFGQKLLGHTLEFERRLSEVKDFFNNELTGQISGAVGNYTILTPEIENLILSKLGLHTEEVSTQVIPRDRIAKLISILSLFACALERLCVEIRHLQHSDIAEVFEGFAKGQKGSSTMPHKKNPISCENLTGMARSIRSNLSMALENTILWHERDISHSSCERMYLPDTFGLVAYSLKRLKNTVDNLIVDKEVMRAKVESTFKHLSSYILHCLIKESNTRREDLYKIVQEASFSATDRSSFFSALKSALQSEDEKKLIDKISKESDLEIFGRHTEKIFKRASN